MSRFEVGLNPSIRVDAETPTAAIFAAISMLQKEPHRLRASLLPDEGDLPTVEEMQEILRAKGPDAN